MIQRLALITLLAVPLAGCAALEEGSGVQRLDPVSGEMVETTKGEELASTVTDLAATALGGSFPYIASAVGLLGAALFRKRKIKPTT